MSKRGFLNRLFSSLVSRLKKREYLISNLPADIFSPEDLRELYWKRWSIEASFRSLKYALSLVFYLQGLPVVSLAFAYIAWNIYIRQEQHFYFYYSVAVACLASAPLHIEAEPAFAVASELCLRKLGEEISYMCEHPGICCRI